MEDLHSVEKLCHYDLKAENITWDPIKERLRFIGTAINSQIVQTNLSENDDVYQAPEKFANRPFWGVKADIFRLGILFFYITFRRYPFEKHTHGPK